MKNYGEIDFLEGFFPIEFDLWKSVLFSLLISLWVDLSLFATTKTLAIPLDKIEISKILVFGKSKVPIPEDDTLLITLL